LPNQKLASTTGNFFPEREWKGIREIEGQAGEQAGKQAVGPVNRQSYLRLGLGETER
jgi:hypothetical protein